MECELQADFRSLPLNNRDRIRAINSTVRAVSSSLQPDIRLVCSLIGTAGLIILNTNTLMSQRMPDFMLPAHGLRVASAKNVEGGHAMPVIGAVVVLIQFCFAFHALKTGRPYWWLFVIMAFPVMGCVIYYFVEVFPGSKEHRKVHKTARAIAKALEPDADLKRRAEELEICGSVDNKRALAEECVNHQMYAEAIKLYESCLQGAFANDATVLYGLARAAIEGDNWSKARSALGRLKMASPKTRPLEVRLLEARLFEGTGENDAAIAVYRELVPQFVGLEARYRYGMLLTRLGRHEAALQVLNEVITHAKRFASSIDDEQQWVAAARRAIAA